MFPRDIEKKLQSLAKTFPVVSLLGPRQSGKTTLVKNVFPNHTYTNLENINQRELAQKDPLFFLKSYKKSGGIIIDEAQHAPDLFSQIQLDVDENGNPGEYIITGSHNFLMNEKISQTLAGRVAILDLLPLSFSELQQMNLLPSDLDLAIWQGCYPRVIEKNLSPADWYANYIRTYLERDVRQIKNLPDLSTFQRFLRLCAGRIGQLINFSDLGRDCGISYHTAQGWLSILEASFIIFLLPPFYTNFNKRQTKSPKLYFYDTGIACSLLQIESPDELRHNYFRGNLFESYIISQLMKQRFNQGKRSNLFFWRDQKGYEVDCILDKGKDKLIPIEIKSSQSIAQDFFKHLKYWCELAQIDPRNAYLIYGGDENQIRREANVLSWSSLLQIEN